MTLAAILVLAGCQPDWTGLVDTEPASRLDTPSTERIDAADAAEQAEMPEQDATAILTTLIRTIASLPSLLPRRLSHP